MRRSAARETTGVEVDSAAVKVLLVGSGGREHALAWKLAQAPGLAALHAAPGNPGIARLGDCHPVRAEDGEALLGLARSLDVDLAVIGPEAPLVAGVADELRRNGVAVFGPGRSAARIEGSKSFAKDVMAAAGVPTAESLAVARAPCVVKVDGLAAGKGVFVCETAEQLDEGLRAASAFPGPIVIEELLAGEEVSVFALADGRAWCRSRRAQDFKRIGDGDTGPNTGGMGSYSPVPGMGADEVAELVEQVHLPGRRGARPAGVAVHRRALRRADADRVRAEGARVQLPLRRPGDAVDPAAPRGRLPRRAGGCRGRRARRRRARRVRRRRRHRRARGGRLSGALRHRLARSPASRTRRRTARSSFTPGPRCAATGWSRTAAGSWASPAPARRSARRASAPTRAASGSRSPAPATAPTSRFPRPALPPEVRRGGR